MIDEKALEAAARAVERHNKAPYGWSDDEFETWWSRDTRFNAKLDVIRCAKIAITAYLQALSPGSTGETEGWRDIESAPKGRVGLDRQVIQLWDGKRVRQGYWDDNRFANKPRPFWAYEGSFRTTGDRQNPPTHWRRLPAPPSAMLSAAGER